MALVYADIQTITNGPAFGQPLQTRVKANRQGGRIRHFEATYVAPASGTAPAIGDKIVFGKLPAKARILGHASKLYWTTGTAACTLALGDNVVAARHLAATAVTTAGSALPEASAITNTATGTTTTGSASLTACTSMGSFALGASISGTGIPTGATITAIDFGSKTVTVSAVATATGAGVTFTVNGSSYETQDDSNNVANGFLSTTDDATLVGTVAGAQVANNQVFTLKVAFVTD